ncbi:PLATZ transcription factor family protein [Striga hermonthica]|uniref:PLATZ transcription factor family protein n=1 Tax=Striga hermonthica TaxID=68872 RepID=A0A9N7RDB6_STRHE|nr:PLATZ transcription factor family protein [Striga hermonthica]
MQKNEHNRYCITCDAPICRYCISCGGHKSHEILTIYRHVYQNVVPLSEMETHMDCQTIQPYKCNKKWVVSLTPLPHNGSGSLIEGDGACNVCKRKLTDSDRFRFCSISCKVQAISGVRRGQHGVGTSQVRDGREQADNPSKRKRSRKGVPHRAPFF